MAVAAVRMVLHAGANKLLGICTLAAVLAAIDAPVAFESTSRLARLPLLSNWTLRAASISFSEMNSLGTSSRISRPRAISTDSSGDNRTPGACAPSRRVASMMRTSVPKIRPPADEHDRAVRRTNHDSRPVLVSDEYQDTATGRRARVD